MNKRRSLDDTCDIFLSRRRVRSSLTIERAASEFSHYAPTLCAESIGIPPYFLLSGPLQSPELSAPALTSASTKPLPLPGSSGELQPKLTRLANGRHHVPRPRNPFILFRCDLVHQRKVLPRSDLDDTNISRIAGDLWRQMSAAQKKPWVELAAQEKARHALLYPDYKYAPAHNGSKAKKAKNDNAYLEDRPPRQVSQMGAASPSDNPKPRRQLDRPRPYPLPRRRSSSCPPVGAVPVPSHSPLDGWTPALVTQDDMQRRPSRTVMYQSVTPDSVVEPTAPEPASYNPSFPLQGFDWLSAPQSDPLLLGPAYPLPDLNQSPESYAAPNFCCFDNKPTFSSGAGDPGFTAQDLAEMERLAIGTTFTDPFSTLAALSVDHDSLHTFSTTISPFDCSSYSTDSPSSLSSGTFSPN
ncbi:hypothetical protein HD554DRAFT_2174292 [Boletus coccyginus]|nr:hypothetical protein HD554DRAFT_2174292 [Boletus coccyginus]